MSSKIKTQITKRQAVDTLIHMKIKPVTQLRGVVASNKSYLSPHLKKKKRCRTQSPLIGIITSPHVIIPIYLLSHNTTTIQQHE